MDIELQSELESIRFSIRNKEVISFIKSNLDAGREFDIFFPDYEIEV